MLTLNQLKNFLLLAEILHFAKTAERLGITQAALSRDIKKLENEIARLRDENNKLEETVKWMHDLIWQLVKEREEAGIEFEL